MDSKTVHRRHRHVRACQQWENSARRLTRGNRWWSLVISLSPDKIRALGTLFLCVAIALRILAMPLYSSHEGSSVWPWAEITILSGLLSTIMRRGRKLKV